VADVDPVFIVWHDRHRPDCFSRRASLLCPQYFHRAPDHQHCNRASLVPY
jgi:hypothetical protein